MPGIQSLASAISQLNQQLKSSVTATKEVATATREMLANPSQSAAGTTGEKGTRPPGQDAQSVGIHPVLNAHMSVIAKATKDLETASVQLGKTIAASKQHQSLLDKLEAIAGDSQAIPWSASYALDLVHTYAELMKILEKSWVGDAGKVNTATRSMQNLQMFFQQFFAQYGDIETLSKQLMKQMAAQGDQLSKAVGTSSVVKTAPPSASTSTSAGGITMPSIGNASPSNGKW
jgi:hypothetical protein